MEEEEEVNACYLSQVRSMQPTRRATGGPPPSAMAANTASLSTSSSTPFRNSSPPASRPAAGSSSSPASSQPTSSPFAARLAAKMFDNDRKDEPSPLVQRTHAAAPQQRSSSSLPPSPVPSFEEDEAVQDSYLSVIISRHGSVIRPKPSKPNSPQPKEDRLVAVSPPTPKEEIENDEAERSRIVYPIWEAISVSSEDSDYEPAGVGSEECDDAYMSIIHRNKGDEDLQLLEENAEEEVAKDNAGQEDNGKDDAGDLEEEELQDFDSEDSDTEEWERCIDESSYDEKSLSVEVHSSYQEGLSVDDLETPSLQPYSSVAEMEASQDITTKRDLKTNSSMTDREQKSSNYQGMHLYQSRRAQLVIEEEGPKGGLGGAERGLLLTRDNMEPIETLEPYGATTAVESSSASLDKAGPSSPRRSEGRNGEESGDWEIAGGDSAGLKVRMRKLYNKNLIKNNLQRIPGLRKEPTQECISKNWNLEFQELWERKLSGGCRGISKEGLEDEQLFVRLRIGKLASEFTEQALRLGKIIIDEFLNPGAKKTIPPVNMGGIAGGLKYLSHNIFFKFAVDENGIFGGDEWAMKAAAHEIKGLSQYMMLSLKRKITGLHFPLMALVNYRGWRLVASSVLPIDETTIAYGSADSRRTVHADDPVLNEIMRQAAQHLKLKGHFISSRDNSKQVFIHAAGDVEGHKGKDGRYYLLDTHRVMPPTIALLNENKYKTKGNCWYQLFRPEFLRDHAPTPLCSDALSAWGLVSTDPQSFEEHNAEVVYASELLITKAVRYFSDKLNFRYSSEMAHNLPIRRIIQQLHQHGINVRYLGHVRRNVTNEGLRTMLKCEIIARTLKNLLRERWRKVHGESLSAVTVEFYNQVFVWPRSDWWADLHEQIRKRAFLISKEDLKQISAEDRYWIWQRVDDMLGICWTMAYNKILNFNIRRRLPLTTAHLSDAQTPIIDRLFIVSFYEGHVKFQKWKRKRKLHEGMVDRSRYTEMSLRIKGPARVAKLLAETASEEILAGRRKRAHTQSTLLGEIFTDVELPDDVWRGVRWDERVCENICSKYMETLEALTNDVAALNNWAIALKTLAVIKAKKLLQLLRKRQITPAQVPNLTWLFKPSYDKYCEALEVSDKDDSLWYNLGALCYDNGLMELELGNKEIASSHFNNALNKLEHVLSLLKTREGSTIGSVEDTMAVFGEVTIGLGAIYALKASLEPSLNVHARSLLNKAQGLCSQVRQMEQHEEARRRFREMNQKRRESFDQKSDEDRTELEEWEGDGSDSPNTSEASRNRSLRSSKKERKREERKERKREKREAKENEKLHEQRARELPSACLEELIKDIRKQLKAKDALWPFMRKSGKTRLAARIAQPVILDRLASNTNLSRNQLPSSSELDAEDPSPIIHLRSSKAS